MKDIAKDLGISPMAVSKALRDHSDIGKETKARVLKRAAELNYRMDWVARSMKTGRTYLVGLVIPDLMQSFFAEIATALAVLNCALVGIKMRELVCGAERAPPPRLVTARTL